MSTSQIQKLIAALITQFPERSDVIVAAVVAVTAREHIYVHGPPGTGKSLFVRTLAACLNRSYFEYLMSRFTEPSEIFGAVDVNAFRAGKYQRNITGMLPTAEIVFLDEAFKSNSAILNALLTVLNERTYVSCAVPLMSCFAASNELPEGEELSALWDRLLVRVTVDYIEDDTAFESMLVSPGIQVPNVAVDIVAEQEAAKNVAISPDTIQAITALRRACKKAGIACSDRRWKQCLNLVKAFAHIEGRTTTVPDDLEILENVLWSKPSEKVVVAKTIQTVISPSGAVAVEQLDAARDLLRMLDGSADLKAMGAAVNDIGEISKRLAGLPKGRRVDAARDEVKAIKAQIASRAMKAAGLDL